MTEVIDREIAAIKAVLAALEPLDAGVRANVLDYVLRRLGITGQVPVGAEAPTGVLAAPAAAAPAIGHAHIKTLKEQKKPRSANEMAALVAYYLANVVPPAERKQTVSAKDMQTHFKIAGFPLPQAIRVTLQNARTAGYFDSAGEGEYRLNAVGHNLVVHNMPRGDGGAAVAPKRRRRKPAKKPNRARRKAKG